MADRLPPDVVRRVAHLAQLELSEQEVEMFSEQLGAVLQHAEDVKALDLSDVAPSTHALGGVNVLREDEVRAGLDRDAVLKMAPAAEDGRFRVPRVLEEEA